MSDLNPHIESEHLPKPEQQPSSYIFLRFKPPEFAREDEATLQKISVANSLLLGLDSLKVFSDHYQDAPISDSDQIKNALKDSKKCSDLSVSISDLTTLQRKYLSSSDNHDLTTAISVKQQEILSLAQEIGGNVIPDNITLSSETAKTVTSDNIELLEHVLGKVSLANHDLKTPLTTIWGSFQLVRRREDKGEKISDDTIKSIQSSFGKLGIFLTDTSIRLASTFYQEPVTLPVLIEYIKAKLKDGLAEGLIVRSDQMNQNKQIIPQGIKTVTPEQAQIPVLTLLFDRYLAERIGENAASNILNALISSGMLNETQSVSIDFQVKNNEQGQPVEAEVGINDKGPGYSEKMLAEGFGIGVSGTREILQQRPELVGQIIGGTGTAYGQLKEEIEKHGGAFYPAKGEAGGRTVLRLPITNQSPKKPLFAA